MQLVMIRPTNTDSCLLTSNRKALRNWSATITSEAMIASWVMIRMLLGILFLSIEMIVLDEVNTKVRARLMTSAVSSFVVTASAEQIPSTWRVIGFFSASGSRSVDLVCLSIMERCGANSAASSGGSIGPGPC